MLSYDSAPFQIPFLLDKTIQITFKGCALLSFYMALGNTSNIFIATMAVKLAVAETLGKKKMG